MAADNDVVRPPDFHRVIERIQQIATRQEESGKTYAKELDRMHGIVSELERIVRSSGANSLEARTASIEQRVAAIEAAERAKRKREDDVRDGVKIGVVQWAIIGILGLAAVGGMVTLAIRLTPAGG